VTGLRIPRRIALIAIAVLVGAASAASFAESYCGLFLWALHHGLRGCWAAGFPLQVDVFIAVGELALFVALADQWAARSRIAAWAVTAAGLLVSVAGNVGHIAGNDLASRATAAIPRWLPRQRWQSGSACSSGWWHPGRDRTTRPTC